MAQFRFRFRLRMLLVLMAVFAAYFGALYKLLELRSQREDEAVRISLESRQFVLEQRLSQIAKDRYHSGKRFPVAKELADVEEQLDNLNNIGPLEKAIRRLQQENADNLRSRQING